MTQILSNGINLFLILFQFKLLPPLPNGLKVGKGITLGNDLNVVIRHKQFFHDNDYIAIIQHVLFVNTSTSLHLPSTRYFLNWTCRVIFRVESCSCLKNFSKIECLKIEPLRREFETRLCIYAVIPFYINQKSISMKATICNV